MPYRPNTLCRHPSCAALVPYGQKYCEKHKALYPEECAVGSKTRVRKEVAESQPGIPDGASTVCAVYGETAAAVCENDSG